MGTGAQCALIEPAPGEWYYVLEDIDDPAEGWDWRASAKAYGPFDAANEARDHLLANHDNPGGHTITPHDMFVMDAVFQDLVDDAPLNRLALDEDLRPGL